MSKIKCSRCELVSAEDVSFLEGKLKTFVDTLGLPEKAEKAQKDIIQMIIWDWFNFITGHYTDHLSEKRKWHKEYEEKRKEVEKIL